MVWSCSDSVCDTVLNSLEILDLRKQRAVSKPSAREYSASNAMESSPQ